MGESVETCVVGCASVDVCVDASAWACVDGRVWMKTGFPSLWAYPPPMLTLSHPSDFRHFILLEISSGCPFGPSVVYGWALDWSLLRGAALSFHPCASPPAPPPCPPTAACVTACPPTMSAHRR
eukprot:7945-Chlamydomonas_euryale.AAC.1